LPLAPDGQVRKARVPILMYHYVGGLPANPDIYRVDLTVTPDKFEAQLAYLQTAGYTGITLEDLVRHLAEGAPLPPKPIILTFDDGYIDNLLYAFPLLRQYGFPGTFFVITGFLDEGRPGYISWEQARLMQEGGMDIQSHSVSHEELRQKPAEYLVSEITGSQQAIEERLQKPARFFAYPFGRYDQQAIEVLRAAGYWAAVTTAAGVEHSSQALFELRRVRVHGAHPLDRFADTLEYYER
jgi:peptidoglycan/xylan/chitin deacetylase (PgdA/CDA1 family)